MELGKKFNIQVDFFKFFRIEGVPSKDFRKERIHLLEYTAVIFTSKNAIDHFFRMAQELRTEIPDTMKYFCCTESIAFYLQKYVQYRKRKIFHGKQSFADLIEVIKKHKTEKFLFPCSDLPKQDVPKLMEKNKIAFKKATIYRTIANDISHLDLKSYDLLVFFSPAGIRSLMTNQPEFQQGEILIGAFGASTAKAVKDAGLTLNINAPTKTAPSMATAIEQYMEKSGKIK